MAGEVQENCGLVAILSNKPDRHLKTALVAAQGVQHRGQNGIGICLQTEMGLVSYKSDGLLKHVFSERVIKEFDYVCKWMMLHCRYGTYGGYEQFNLQPEILKDNSGQQVAVIHNGEFVETEAIRKLKRKKENRKLGDTMLFTKLLVEAEGESWDEKILETLKKVKGAFSLIIGVNDDLYLIRDPDGIRPLVIGKINDSWIAASETIALEKVHAKILRKVRPGEVIKLSKGKQIVIKKGKEHEQHFCDFEWAYFSRPDSRWPVDGQRNHKTWRSFAEFRYRCGQILADETGKLAADFVIGVPDSGVYFASGFAEANGLPYKPLIVRDHFSNKGDQRLFLNDKEKDKISSLVLGKLSLVADHNLWNGARVVVGDDSIVRSNVSRRLTEAIYKLGAKEVHWVVGFPMVKHPCHLGVSMRTKKELVAAKFKGDVNKIAKFIGANSVNYISHQGFLKAKLGRKFSNNGHQKDIFLTNGGCGGCLTGCYPVDK